MITHVQLKEVIITFSLIITVFVSLCVSSVNVEIYQKYLIPDILQKHFLLSMRGNWQQLSSDKFDINTLEMFANKL